MKAMILAAGLGTRLRPLTDTHPTALVEINGRTLLEITLSRLRSFGINEVIVNVHHLADMVVDYLKSHDNFGMRIEVSREDDLLLDTGGGLKKASWFFLEHHRSPAAQGAIRGALRPSLPQPEKDKRGGVIPSLPAEEGAAWDKLLPRQGTALAVPERDQDQRALAPEASDQREEPFLLHNVDVITSIDFRRMLQFHNEHHALATLGVQSRPSSRLLLFNDQLQLVGRAVTGSAPSDLTSAPHSSHSLLTTHYPLLPLAFSGIHIISRRLLTMLTEEGAFSIIDAYLRLAAQGEKILAFRADDYYWRDLGRPADLSQAAIDLKKGML